MLSWGQVRRSDILSLRAWKRGILLGERDPALEEGPLAYPYLALSPRLLPSQALRMAEEEEGVLWYLALNPKVATHPEVARRILEALARSPEEGLRNPYAPEGRALRSMLALAGHLSKPLRKRALELARRHGVPWEGSFLEPVAVGKGR